MSRASSYRFSLLGCFVATLALGCGVDADLGSCLGCSVGTGVTNDHPPLPRGECECGFEDLAWSASRIQGEEGGPHPLVVVPGLALPTIDRGIVYNESG